MLVAWYYYSLEAESQLRHAQFKQADIKLIIDTEIIPTIKFLDKTLASGNPNKLCEVKEDFRKQLEESANALKGIRWNIITKIDDASDGLTTNKGLMGLSGLGAAVAVGVIATAPCLGTALLACPHAVAGNIKILISFFFSYFLCSKHFSLQ